MAVRELTYEEVAKRNPRERMKAEKFPLDILEEVTDLMNKGYEAVPEEDMVRLQWWGLYHDKPRLGYFMMRVKLPNGILSPKQARVVGEISERFGRGYAEIANRQNIQLHWIRMEDIPEIFSMLAEVGLTTAGGCGDVVRNITGCPLAGVNPDELFDTRPTVMELANYMYGNRKYSNLPRKHKITVSSCVYQCNAPEIHCIALIGVVKEDGGERRLGYTVRIGGGLSSAPRISRHLPVFVEVGDALELVRAIIDVWKDTTRYRQSFVRARLKFMVDDFGVDGMRKMIEERLGYRLEDYGPCPTPNIGTAHPHLGITKQKQDGLYSIGVPVQAGYITGKQIIGMAEIAEDVGGEIRLTMQQNMVITNVPEERLEEVKSRIEKNGLKLELSRIRRESVACTGDPYCNYAVGETKMALIRILNHLEGKGLADVGVRINLDGCPHACGHHWVGDIGLQGTTVRTESGSKYAFDIIVGGGYASQASIGKVIARRVPAEVIHEWVERLIRAYVERRREGESFREFCIRSKPEELVSVMSNPEGGGEVA